MVERKGPPDPKATAKAPPGKAPPGKAPPGKAPPPRTPPPREVPSSRRAMIKAPTAPPPRDPTKGLGRKLTDAEVKKAAAEGKKIVAYSPTELAQWAQGNRTLGELQGISKKQQYEMAEVGYRLLTEGKLKEGKDVFFGLVALDPFDAYFLTCLGSAHQQTGDAATAERLYTRALEINPYGVTARAHRGELHALAGRLREAVDDLERVLKDDPGGKDPATQRAVVLLRTIQAQLH